ncbi:primosomal protein [[Mycobacterium] wendilense]|uniref:Primosomal protein n=1 Tax=[Mycobacterium] wendilense TaxID=3064284 RepID=A0ABN9P8U0_9MYCO|nr:primosomal protein [Mycolicibacterium sp. MU0050]CAJ1584963.1 primosomal protein [Mycolicibacterium sp. MU0050]
MAADLVPIRLGVTAGDLYTLWAPRWREGGDEWEAFLGEGEDLYGFASVADLVAFVRSGADNDLSDHPAWDKVTEANAHRLDPAEDRRFDLITVEELLAEKPTEDSVNSLARTLAVVSSLGSVCELPTVTKFFNGNPTLAAVNGGAAEFSGKAGLKRWANIAAIVGRSWDKIIAAIDEIITTPDVDATLAAKAAKELAEPAPPDEDDLADDGALEAADDAEREEPAQRAVGDTVVLGDDDDFWAKVGIDPIRVMTSGGTFYTLRCYFDDRPIFLGRNGRVSVFGSERALARYLADEHDHDLSDLSTYDDIRTAATDGSLDIDITDDNVYVLTELADDIADGPDAVDRDQLELAVEFLRDLGDYSEEDTVDKALAPDAPLGRYVDYVLDGTGRKPTGSFAEAVTQFERLERFVESRLRSE